jgi:hypothetical protein
MTSIDIKQRLENWATFHCTHKGKISMLCNSCWEYKGISSRFVERHMKNIDVKFLLKSCPSDLQDFCGFHEGIMKDHPEWRERILEMGKYTRDWYRFSRNYETMASLYENNNLEFLQTHIDNIVHIKGELLFRKLEEEKNKIELLEQVIVCSFVPQKIYDQFDISHIAIMKKVENENILCKEYSKDGKYCGSFYNKLINPLEEKKTITKNDIRKLKDSEQMFCDSFNGDVYNFDEDMCKIYNDYKNGKTIENLPDINDYHKIDENQIENLRKSIDEFEIIDNFDILSIEEIKNYRRKLNTITSSIDRLNWLLEKSKLPKEFIDLKDTLKGMVNILTSIINEEYKNENEFLTTLDSGLKEQCEIFSSLAFNYCPHYVFFDEKDDGYDPETFKMHAVEFLVDIPTTMGFQFLIVSFSQNHKLNTIHEIDGVQCTISDPIEFNTYYDEGMLNAC